MVPTVWYQKVAGCCLSVEGERGGDFGIFSGFEAIRSCCPVVGRDRRKDGQKTDESDEEIGVYRMRASYIAL